MTIPRTDEPGGQIELQFQQLDQPGTQYLAPRLKKTRSNDSATKGMEVEEMGDRHIGRGLSQTATVFTTILCR
jgi:hypothetical protein